MEAGQVAFQKKLTEALVNARLRNPSYSLRAFSKRVGLSPSAVSEIMSGKRRVSKKIVAKTVEKLDLDPNEAGELLRIFGLGEQTSSSAKAGELKSHYEDVPMDHFRVVSEWFHFAILSLAEIPGFKSEPQWISRRLGIKTQDAVAGVERLVRLGMLKRTPGGKLKPTGAQYRSPDGVASSALRNVHSQNLELARNSLLEDPVELRDFTSVTMAIEVDKIPQAKKMIREFQDQISQVLETGDKKEVYKLCVQMIPLSRADSFEKGEL